ncbi:MAG TPA: tryptophan-rich sensory protein [Leeuwenhoekiella sp.]|uniref:tryptophan-rich sensory protein n=1 Tax=Leeuwenhoekiella palythoae TaxID=573501 RepID=UPI000E8A0CEE|nr:tryptophan-rich sensory protein [Leeuwenhoekiella palythoae]UBZ09660.1 tryptophan-rich sensory protein [Leeuwenhoekiella palythoae]HAX14562.1 tryptophan-rich sensory protein [Leeuwenhoekiella sp.]HBO29093.1 tryptophan-rich sensory protein [Leeuwenhoekiella sp.]HCQ75779.1 tryptophan-rich sensory protein [Leeuwenhoekiella sp.]|tara:strand:- start:41018 stop:43249 length:2232 start_codon:yes stop_codon:yes gene_type:complete
MSNIGRHSVLKFKQRWQSQLWLLVLLLALLPAMLLFILTKGIVVSLLLFMVLATVGSLLYKPLTLGISKVLAYIDARIHHSEYSAGLVFQPTEELSSLGQIQRYRTEQKLANELKALKTPIDFKHFGFLLFGVLVGTLILGVLLNTNDSLFDEEAIQPENEMVIRAVDSAEAKIIPPKIIKQAVTVRYPGYTGIAARTSEKMDIKALEGSQITWILTFDQPVDSVFMESQSAQYAMKTNAKTYQRTQQLTTSGFYSFRFVDTLGNAYVSDLHSIETLVDAPPQVDILNLDQFTSFEPGDEKNIAFDTQIIDDYGIGAAYIVATVSRGSGESVKFREEQIAFNSTIAKGSKQQSLSQQLNLDQLKMEPGDELYFYVHAQDLKTPKPNVARSETYFAVIKDTTAYEYVEAGGMGVDLLPDYFRSQRQLIIDTEKLLKNKPNLSAKEFNSTSNELAFDQKSLRLKYGEFMGDEAEGGLAAQTEDPGILSDEDADPLAEYSHRHDSSNDHNLVEEEHEHEHEHEGEETEEEDPLEKYVHNHSDPEESTLFAKSLKQKLREALNIMWDAELHLRMFEPEKSLPYQNEALKLIQEIKNSSRIYVHRIGFDPPPIKEDKRLTGELKEVSSVTKQEDLEQGARIEAIQKAISRIEGLIAFQVKLTPEDQQLFEDAGNELAALAIEHPGNYLETLQQLNWISQNLDTDIKTLKELQNGLLKALPAEEAKPNTQNAKFSKLDAVLVKNLDADE